VALVSVASWAQGLRRWLRISGGESFLELLDHIQPSLGLGALPDELLAAFGFTPFSWRPQTAAGAAGTFAQAQLLNPTGSRILAVVGNWYPALADHVLGIGPQQGSVVAGFVASAQLFNLDSRQAKTAGGTSGVALSSPQLAQAASAAASEIQYLFGKVFVPTPRIVLAPGSSVFLRQVTAAQAMDCSAAGYYRQFEDTELNV
jgi:hypothetical protein